MNTPRFVRFLIANLALMAFAAPGIVLVFVAAHLLDILEVPRWLGVVAIILLASSVPAAMMSVAWFSDRMVRVMSWAMQKD
jgi:hypothetical protein